MDTKKKRHHRGAKQAANMRAYQAPQHWQSSGRSQAQTALRHAYGIMRSNADAGRTVVLPSGNIEAGDV